MHVTPNQQLPACHCSLSDDVSVSLLVLPAEKHVITLTATDNHKEMEKREMDKNTQRDEKLSYVDNKRRFQ